MTEKSSVEKPSDSKVLIAHRCMVASTSEPVTQPPLMKPTTASERKRAAADGIACVYYTGFRFKATPTHTYPYPLFPP